MKPQKSTYIKTKIYFLIIKWWNL